MIELLRRFGGKFRRYMVIGPACKLIEVIFDLLTPLVKWFERGILWCIGKCKGLRDKKLKRGKGVLRAAAILLTWAVVLAMLWLYICMSILFYGGVLCRLRAEGKCSLAAIAAFFRN